MPRSPKNIGNYVYRVLNFSYREFWETYDSRSWLPFQILVQSLNSTPPNLRSNDYPSFTHQVWRALCATNVSNVEEIETVTLTPFILNWRISSVPYVNTDTRKKYIWKVIWRGFTTSCTMIRRQLVSLKCCSVSKRRLDQTEIKLNWHSPNLIYNVLIC